MNLLFIGDVMGKSGREALAEHLPKLQKKYAPCLTIVNADNAAHGFGLTEKIALRLLELDVDLITAGDHIWDQREFTDALPRLPRVIRPLNYPPDTPGQGLRLVQVPGSGEKVLVVQLVGRLFMKPADNPFTAMDQVLKDYRLGKNDLSAIFVDFHAEATAEKQALGHYLDGKVTAVIGSHTHVPTADVRLLLKGTAFQTDVGMTGDYNSVIGQSINEAIRRLRHEGPRQRLEPCTGSATVCGCVIKVDKNTGLATRIEAFQRGAKL